MKIYFHQQSPETSRFFEQENGRNFMIQLEEMPHYKFLRDWLRDPLNPKNPYYRYISCSWQTSDTDRIESQIKKFVCLHEDIKSKGYIETPVNLIQFPDNSNSFLIFDGNHRASICKALGLTLKYEVIQFSEWISSYGYSENKYNKNEDGLFYQTLIIGEKTYYGRRQDIVERTKRIRSKDIKGKRVLDLGCNIGSQCFEAKKLKATEVLGIEIDRNMSYFSCRINNVFGFENTRFILHDLNTEFEHDFDTVFCFSILAHINNKDAVLKTLKRAKECIYLEGHEGTTEKDYEFIFREFKGHELLGHCSDGIHSENKTRPFFRIQV